MTVRLAGEQDRQLLVNDYLRFVNRDMEEANRYALINLQIDRTLILEEMSLLFGFLHWGQRDHLDEGLAQITSMRVLPTQRNRGIGGRLLEAALEDMQSFFADKGSTLRRVFAIVEDNPIVARLFERYGFQLQASLPGHFKEEKTGLVYIWEPNIL